MTKNIQIFILLLLSTSISAQFINVDGSKTADDLVRNVFLNSSCIVPSNIKSSTGSNFGSTNGIGSFQNSNPAFPLQQGIILTTGNIANCPGPNTTRLQDGNSNWGGDPDLTTIFTTDPNFPAQFVNATSLEFDFVSYSPNFNFPFLFASEEYGTYQCTSFDGMAILLTHPNGTVENLALVPNTNLPISIENIRDNLYNSSCNSSNAASFGIFNGGIGTSIAPINFNGQTILLNATKTGLTQGATYHLKIVIGDRNLTSDDSAIFIGGGNFNFGTDILGPDVSLCTNDGVNQNYTIDSKLNPNQFDFVWKDHTGTTVGTNSPTLTINQPDTYYLSYYIKNTTCEVATNDITINYEGITNNISSENLYKCNVNSTTYTFNLGYNTSLLDPNKTYNINYYNTLTEAQNASTPALPLNYTINSTLLPKTVWVRIENGKGCYLTKSFKLDLTPGPIAIKPADITTCELVQGDGTGLISQADFATTSSTVLNGQSSTIYQISYHLKPDFSDPPFDITQNSILKNTVFYIKVALKSDSNCFTNTTLQFIVKNRPVLEIIPNQYVCSQYILTIPSNGAQYWTGPGQTGIQLAPGTPITTTQTIYQYLDTGGNPNCFSERSFKVQIVKIQDITPATIKGCDSATVPDNNIPLTKYYTDALHTNEITPGTVITTIGTTTIYLVYNFADPNCPPIASSFEIQISRKPTILSNFNSIFECGQLNSLPTIITDIGTANYYTLDTATGNYLPLILPITSTTNIYAIADNNGCKSDAKNFTVYINSLDLKDINLCNGSYTLSSPLFGEYRTAPNGGGTLINTPAVLSQNITIYHYIPGKNCTNTNSFKIVFHSPSIQKPTDIAVCEKFILPNNNPGESYYTLQGGPNTPNNKLLKANDVISDSVSIWIYKESTTAPSTLNPVCYNEILWNITIYKKPEIDQRGDQISCFSYHLTPLTNGNYYEDPNGVNKITDFHIDSTDLRPGVETNSRVKTIYIFNSHPKDPTCFTQSSFTITFDSLEVLAQKNIVSCDNYVLPVLPQNMFYYDQPYDPAHPELPHPGNLLPAGTKFDSTSLKTPIYVYTETNNKLKCIDEKSFTLTIHNTPIANQITTDFTVCDTYKDNFDAIYSFDLTKVEKDVLGNQTPATNYAFKYFKTKADAENKDATGIPNQTSYENTLPNETIWVRIYNTASPNLCFGITSFEIRVNPLPKSNLEPEYFICEDYKTGTLYNDAILKTGLDTTNYNFEWFFNNTPLNDNNNTLTTNQTGDYSVNITNTNTKCSKTYSTKVTKYNPYIVLEYSDAFENPSYIKINVQGNGSGNYLYQIDDSPFQESNIFYNLSSGEHSIHVIDQTGNCSPASIKTTIINYPKFFTPNGDGFNDTWNIWDLIPTNPNAKIYIFDRYEKLIKEITPITNGWDGTFAGVAIPSDDYWFTVEFEEKNVKKIYKSHFTLKR